MVPAVYFAFCGIPVVLVGIFVYWVWLRISQLRGGPPGKFGKPHSLCATFSAAQLQFSCIRIFICGVSADAQAFKIKSLAVYYHQMCGAVYHFYCLEQKPSNGTHKWVSRLILRHGASMPVAGDIHFGHNSSSFEWVKLSVSSANVLTLGVEVIAIPARWSWNQDWP